MSRYLMKYKGIYRLKIPYDLKTKDFPRDINGHIDREYDDIYIVCYYGNQIYHYGHGVLRAYVPILPRAKDIIKKINKIDNSIILKVAIYSKETLIDFKDKNLERIIHLFKPMVNGKNISPFSKKNLPNGNAHKKYEPYEIKSQELIELKKKLLVEWKDGNMSIYLKLYRYLEKEHPDKEFKNQKYAPFAMIEVNGCIDTALRISDL